MSGAAVASVRDETSDLSTSVTAGSSQNATNDAADTSVATAFRNFLRTLTIAFSSDGSITASGQIDGVSLYYVKPAKAGRDEYRQVPVAQPAPYLIPAVLVGVAVLVAVVILMGRKS